MIELRERTKKHVIEYFDKSNDAEIAAVFPSGIESLDQALELFEASQGQGSTSYGKTIYADGKYIGDVWIFAIDEIHEKMAMLSIVIFDKSYWGKGMGGQAIKIFTKECFTTYKIDKLGAFTYTSNVRSLGALKKVGFEVCEQFVENDIESYYLEKQR